MQVEVNIAVPDSPPHHERLRGERVFPAGLDDLQFRFPPTGSVRARRRLHHLPAARRPLRRAFQGLRAAIQWRWVQSGPDGLPTRVQDEVVQIQI